jgi:dihydrolipoamide dehydrogenase
MTTLVEVKIPDIGDFSDVEVIEVLVKPGAVIARDDSIITLESDKATMEIPAPEGGSVRELKVKVGDRVSQGDPILVLEKSAESDAGTRPVEVQPLARAAAGADAPAARAAAATGIPAAASARPVAPAPAKEGVHAEIAVLGSGPGGYTAAFRAADLGKQVVLIERYPVLGGVCLNVGCIPSKALLHVAKVLSEVHEIEAAGIEFGQPKVDLAKLRAWKQRIVGQLTGGLASMAKQRKVTVVQGTGKLTGANQLSVTTPNGEQTVTFDQLIIASGSGAARIPGLPYGDPRLLDSTSALEVEEIPKRLLVIGGGIIGLELATVYHELGTRVTVVELLDGLMPGVDRDIVRPLEKRIAKRYENIFVGTRVAGVEARADGLLVRFQGPEAPAEDRFARVLVAVGRTPNARSIGAEQAGVHVNECGFIPVDKQQRTNVAHIFAIGDVVGQPMLAHKASHEGKIAAEVAAGLKSGFDARVVPSVAYTDPEVAWVGVTETEAKQRGQSFGKSVFPWAANGRSLSLGRNEGLTKLLFDEATERIVGAGIVGPNAGDLIAEITLAIEMGCDAHDIGLTIHPHPTLSETIGMSAEAFTGTITDLYMPKRK